MSSSQPAGRGNSTITRLARCAVAVILVVLLVRQVDVADAVHHLIYANWLDLALGLLMLGLSRFVKAARSYPLMRVQSTELPFWRCLRAYLASGSAAYLLPTGFGGDVLRAMALGRSHGLVPEVTASIAMERVLSGVAMVAANLFAALYALHGRQPGRFALGSIGLAILATAAMLVPLNQGIRAWIGRRLARFSGSRWVQTLARFGNAYYAYRDEPGVLIVVFVLSLAESVLIVLCMAFLAHATGTGITPGMLLVVVPLTLVLHRLPITYWGIGVADGGFAFLLHQLYLIPATQALTVAAAYRVAELLSNIPGALLWRELAIGRPRTRPAPGEIERPAGVRVGTSQAQPARETVDAGAPASYDLT